MTRVAYRAVALLQLGRLSVVAAWAACVADTPSCSTVRCFAGMVEMMNVHHPTGMLLVLSGHFEADLAALAGKNCPLLLIASSLLSLETSAVEVHVMK